jgi:hypothetical protein
MIAFSVALDARLPSFVWGGGACTAFVTTDTSLALDARAIHHSSRRSHVTSGLLWLPQVYAFFRESAWHPSPSHLRAYETLATSGRRVRVFYHVTPNTPFQPLCEWRM